MVAAFLLGLALNPTDRSALVDGVDSLIAPGALPGAVVASKSAFVALRTGDVPTVAAGPVGAGRAMVVGHGGFFARESLRNPSNARLFANALTWLSRKPVRGLRIGVLGTDDVTGAARSLGAETVSLKREGLAKGLREVDVLLMGQGALDGDGTGQTAVLAWTKTGHGLYAAGPTWGWQQLNPTKDVRTDLSANRMLLPYGLGLSGDIADGTPVTAGAEDPLLQTDSALAGLRRGGLAPGQTARATGAVSRALFLSPIDDPGLVKEIRRLARAEGTGTWPVTLAMPFSRLDAIVKFRAWKERGAEAVEPDPSAALFPGPVPKAAKRIRRTVEIDTNTPDWHGIGLYAAPGEAIEVTLPASSAGKGLAVRIGSHTDTLWDAPKWNRFPEITRRWPLVGATTKVASPFGGTIFIEVPEACRLGKIAVEVRGAVAAPRYVRGKTSREEWGRMLAEPGGPWVEMEAREIVLSLPRSAVANLTDPETAMAYWDEMADLCYGLYAAPRRRRPERFCVDRQISNGYMHAGYPIMTHEDVAATFTDVAKLRSKEFPWGFYHELGHNFQEPGWTFDGTGEVTNNLFSLYACEKINGIAHPGDMRLDKRRERMEKYLAKGARYEDWQSDPFLALTMYDQIREAFGWEPFTKAFAAYHEQRLKPEGEEAKRDTWMVQISRATGRNLGPLFVAWGIPTSESARASVANLPAWMPADWPKS
ncbi:MAG: M60 family metallopeptidase [Fimbriimonas sp.]